MPKIEKLLPPKNDSKKSDKKIFYQEGNSVLHKKPGN